MTEQEEKEVLDLLFSAKEKIDREKDKKYRYAGDFLIESIRWMQTKK
jgi:hypothetical protein